MNSEEISRKITETFKKRCFDLKDTLTNQKNTKITNTLWKWDCNYWICKSWRSDGPCRLGPETAPVCFSDEPHLSPIISLPLQTPLLSPGPSPLWLYIVTTVPFSHMFCVLFWLIRASVKSKCLIYHVLNFWNVPMICP